MARKTETVLPHPRYSPLEEYVGKRTHHNFGAGPDASAVYEAAQEGIMNLGKSKLFRDPNPRVKVDKDTWQFHLRHGYPTWYY